MARPELELLVFAATDIVPALVNEPPDVSVPVGTATDTAVGSTLFSRLSVPPSTANVAGFTAFVPIESVPPAIVGVPLIVPPVYLNVPPDCMNAPCAVSVPAACSNVPFVTLSVLLSAIVNCPSFTYESPGREKLVE